MARRFASTYHHKVEDRGRVALPANFRKVFVELGSRQVYVLPQFDTEDAHLCLTEAGFESYLAKIEAELDPDEVDEVIEDLHADAQILDIDEAGRIVLPRPLREVIGVTNEIMFRGAGFHFELRAPAEARERGPDERARARDLRRRVKLRGIH